MSWLDGRFVTGLIRLVEGLVIVLVAGVTCLVFAEVVLRDSFGYSLVITEEAARYAMIWVAMLGSALLVADDGHIRIDVVPALAPAPVKLALNLISQVLVLGFLAVLTVTTLTIMPEVSRDQTVTLGISMAAIYAALPISGVLMILLTLRNMARAVAKYRAAPAVAMNGTSAP
jgi:TRAP-type C4-dicarboxylate transport system permease small subunit